MFKPHLLTEICTLYGTGPKEKQEVAYQKNLAAAYAGRLGHPTTPIATNPDVHMEVKWVAFVNDVGEGYMTFPPRGHGVELAKQKLWSEKVRACAPAPGPRHALRFLSFSSLFSSWARQRPTKTARAPPHAS